MNLHTTPGYPLAVHADRNLVATGSTIHTAVMVWDLDRVETGCMPDIKVSYCTVHLSFYEQTKWRRDTLNTVVATST